MLNNFTDGCGIQGKGRCQQSGIMVLKMRPEGRKQEHRNYGRLVSITDWFWGMQQILLKAVSTMFRIVLIGAEWLFQLLFHLHHLKVTSRTYRNNQKRVSCLPAGYHEPKTQIEAHGCLKDVSSFAISESWPFV